MPIKHAKDKKLEALELLSYGRSVSTVHFATGIPIRTLYNWKTQLNRKYEGQVARKQAENAANAPQNRESRHKTSDSCHTIADPCHNHADENGQLPQDCQNDASTAANPENTDVEDFTFIRDKLMICARQMAADLRPNEPDTNRHTLALARVLDRIQWLDEKVLPDRIPEQTIRFEYFYDGQVHEHPPWHDPQEEDT